MKIKFATVVGFISAMAACDNNDPIYPLVPQLTFSRYEFQRTDNGGLIEDSYLITVEYIDGDGDIGLDNEEDGLPGDTSIKHVLYVDYYEKNQDGKYRKKACALGSDTTTKKYRFPIITPTGNNKAIKGEIQVKVLPCPLPLDTVKTIRFGIYIYDRAAQKSNVTFSPDIAYETQTR